MKRCAGRNRSRDGGERKSWNSLLRGQEGQGELALSVMKGFLPEELILMRKRRPIDE
jgi:hypothetical protein